MVHNRREHEPGHPTWITGSLQQQTPSPEQPRISEWFVRVESGRPILLYVYGSDVGSGVGAPGPDSGDDFEDGQTITIPARFYKRVEAVARDGRVHEYAAFVGAFPRLVATDTRDNPRDDRWAGMWLVAAPIMIMMGVFILLLIYARRGGRRPRGAISGSGV